MTEWLWCCTLIVTLPHSNWYLQTDLGQMLLKTWKELYRSIQNERLQSQHELGPVGITGESTSHWLANPVCLFVRYKPMVFEMGDYHTSLEVKWEIWRTGRRICWHSIPMMAKPTKFFWVFISESCWFAAWPAWWSDNCSPQFFIFRQWNCLAFGCRTEYLSVFTHVN